MKLQIQNDSLRLRIDEAQLATLLDGGALRLSPRLGASMLLDLSLRLGDRLEFEPAADWQITLPRDAVHAYVETLPTRDALSFPLDGGAMSLQFEVDVRDSLQQRGPRRRQR